MPMYGSVFHEAILGQSLSLLMQPGWLGLWGLFWFSPARTGGHLEGNEVHFFPYPFLFGGFIFWWKLSPFLLF